MFKLNILLMFLCRVYLPLAITFWVLTKVAIFTTNVDAENQCLNNHKCVCGVLNRQFCQIAVEQSLRQLLRFNRPKSE